MNYDHYHPELDIKVTDTQELGLFVVETLHPGTIYRHEFSMAEECHKALTREQAILLDPTVQNKSWFTDNTARCFSTPVDRLGNGRGSVQRRVQWTRSNKLVLIVNYNLSLEELERDYSIA